MDREHRVQITLRGQDVPIGRWGDWHVLTVAEAGFSMLDVYGRHHHGLDRDLLQRFDDDVNARDAGGTLHPHAPISALPRRFFHDPNAAADTALVAEFARRLEDFLVASRETIRGRRVLVDLHVSPEPVPRPLLEAAREVFAQHGGWLDEVRLLS